MPPKFKVTKNEILDAAFALLEANGSSGVTTRAIAEKLGVSSRPVYSFFPSMENIFGELGDMAESTMKSYMQHEYTDDPFLNIGVGFVCFYREKPRVADFMEQKWSKPMFDDSDGKLFDAFFESIKTNKFYKEISRDDLYALYTQMSIYTYGLVQYMKHSWLNLNVNEIIALLEETGEAVIVHHLWKKMGKPYNLG